MKKIILAFPVLLLLAVGCNTTNPTPTPNSQASDQSTTVTYKTYVDSTHRFSFEYPSDWTFNDVSSDQRIGLVVSLSNPNSYRGINTDDVAVSNWPNINNQYAQGYLDRENDLVKTYANLNAYFQDKNIPNQKIAVITFAGQKAYEALLGAKYGELATSYGIMLENNGIYQISFNSAQDKSFLSVDQKHIIDSFTFK